MAKPVSGTALDPAHPLFSHFTNVWALLEGSGTSLADSKGSNTATKDANAACVWGVDAYGDPCIQTTGARPEPFKPGTAIHTGKSHTKSFTLIVRCQKAASSGNEIIAGAETGAGSEYLDLRTNDVRFN